MRATGVPRTSQDVRPSRVVPSRAGPGSEQSYYVRLSQLAKEKQLLLCEQEVWQRKLQRIARRVAEIDTHMSALRRRVMQGPGAPAPLARQGRVRRVQY